MKVGVIGAGTMGSGIAQAFATADGFEVVLCDVNIEFAQKGLDRIKAKLDKLAKKEKITAEQAAAIGGRITVAEKTDLTDVDLVVEAALENMEAKKALFKELQGICPAKTIFSTNTSSLSITEIGAGLDRDMVGMHFFNPADVMKLVEVIAGENTSRETMDKIIDISKQINKVPVEVNEAPGFVVNRILIPMVNEAISVYAEGVASAEGIDTAMKLGCNHPMGPLALADLIGLDVVLAIMEILHFEMGEDKYRPHPQLRKMVRAGKLGRKSGEGFYTY